MGNCMKTCKQTEQEDDLKFDFEEEKDGKAEAGESLKGSSGFGSSGGVRVKLVLTKEELESLLFQLKRNSGGGGGEKLSLEIALREIERGRERVKVVEESTWKPSLESIIETPE
ncbi:hypothetical protein HS088_TW15G00498 [Tripterygium wilfordii]|uniref:Uncharacterized protein n=1 Tax=Tripterygium wilfordii TaxID=458696 RepID=A0A7J7CLR7_TRIWF|nr:uncharacterized protein LOC119979950 [Tripterygium wilfordii]KAF5734999.1 hypothetical protein HS088_TW15G00498 [Tripterygium wilfordii]